MSASAAGRKSIAPPATACAAPVMMVDSLKPTPVSVTTPITMPTAAAAAPTASAYLAPVSNASTSTPRPMRPLTASERISSGVATSTATKMPTLSHSLWISPKHNSSSTACSATISAQLPARLPRGAVVSPTIAHELMPANAARYGVRPLTKMVISSTSGISVGQRCWNDTRSFGISASVRPRRPKRLASKCTCMNTPKKCMNAGTMAAAMIVWYGTARNSIIRNAAAPSTGGVICPPVDDAASTAPANSRR